MPESAVRIVRCFYSSLVCEGSIQSAAIDKHLTDDFIGHHLPLGLNGREGYKRFMRMVGDSFREMTPVALHDLFNDAGKVAARWSITGIHSGEFMGIPATHRRITLKGIDIVRVEDGKIADLWQEIDLVGILQQISANHPTENA